MASVPSRSMRASVASDRTGTMTWRERMAIMGRGKDRGRADAGRCCPQTKREGQEVTWTGVARTVSPGLVIGVFHYVIIPLSFIYSTPSSPVIPLQHLDNH